MFKICFFCLLIVLSLSIIGCGIKSDPFLPRHVFYKNIDKLQYCIDDNDLLTLNWNLGGVFSERSFLGGVLNIHSSKGPLDCDYCSNCPADFLRIVRVQLCNVLSRNGDGLIVSYIDEIVRGNKYSYKLKLVLKDGYTILESDVIRFVYPQKGD